jgi:hypothetical protein
LVLNKSKSEKLTLIFWYAVAPFLIETSFSKRNCVLESNETLFEESDASTENFATASFESEYNLRNFFVDFPLSLGLGLGPWALL